MGNDRVIGITVADLDSATAFFVRLGLEVEGTGSVEGEFVDRRDAYRMVARVAKATRIPRHIGPHSLRHAAITNALDAGVPLHDAQILARHADPRTTEHYDRSRGNLDHHGVHFLTAYVAGV
jgi:integrase/recombinase XerD